MIRLFAAATVMVWASSICIAQEARLFDELEILFPDSDVAAGHQRVHTATPRGVPAGLHVFLSGMKPDAEISCTTLIDGKPAANARFFQLRDVPVEQNTGLEGWTERKTGKNPHVVRRAPFRVFEVLDPIATSAKAGDAGVAALRFEVQIDPQASPGKRRFALTLAQEDWSQTLVWDLDVHAVTIPPFGESTYGYTNWFRTGILAQRHDLSMWSEPYWKMLGQYADLMARGRQNTFWLLWKDFARFDEQGELHFDETRFKRYVRLFLKRGFTRIEGGQIAHRHQGSWESDRLDFILTGEDVSSPKGRAQITALIRAIEQAFEALELPPDIPYLQHIADEPTDVLVETYRGLADLVRSEFEGVQIFEATMSMKLIGAVDHWCPLADKYQRHRDFFEQRRKEGESVWVYTCLAPGGPWINRLLDQERLRPVYIGWGLAKYDLTGYLHWGLHHYHADPFEQSVVKFGTPEDNYLPPGDSHVVYPGKSGPLSGQRFEAQRLGMEDAEMIRIVRERDPALAERLIQRVFRGFDDFDKDVTAYRAARLDLIQAASK